MRIFYWLMVTLFLITVNRVDAQPQPAVESTDSLNFNLHLLKRYLSQGEKWHFTDPLTEKRLSGLIQFIENEPIDTIINHLNRIGTQAEKALVIRYPKDAPDSLSMPGYISYRQLQRQLNTIEEELTKEFRNKSILFPAELYNDLENGLPLIPEGQGMQLFTDRIFALPDSLSQSQGISDDRIQKPGDFKRFLQLDSIRSRYVEEKRVQYNDSLLAEARQVRMDQYRQEQMREQIESEKNRRIEAVKLNNSQVVSFHNNQVIIAVNDSMMKSAEWLADFADAIDSKTIHLVNLTHSSSTLVMSNAGNFFTRIWLKNQQNDSISVLVQSIDKNRMQLVIEDE